MKTYRILTVVNQTKDAEICHDLQRSRYDIICTQSLRKTLGALKNFQPDLILLDVTASTDNKTKRITRAANKHPRCPFVILLKNGRSSPNKAFFYDDVLNKPFLYNRLENRIKRLLASRRSYVINLSPFTLDRRTRILLTPTGKKQLSPKMAALMSLFLTQPGTIINHLELISHVWGVTNLEDIRTLHVHIHWLRKLIEPNPEITTYLKTAEKNTGYFLDIQGQPKIGGDPLFLQ